LRKFDKDGSGQIDQEEFALMLKEAHDTHNFTLVKADAHSSFEDAAAERELAAADLDTDEQARMLLLAALLMLYCFTPKGL
jgi:Ca2+-binding EF-hand superfamily protein